MDPNQRQSKQLGFVGGTPASSICRKYADIHGDAPTLGTDDTAQDFRSEVLCCVSEFRKRSPLESLDEALLSTRLIAVGFDDLASPFETATPTSTQLLTLGSVPVELTGGIHSGFVSNMPSGAAVVLETPSAEVDYEEVLVAKIQSGASSKWGYDFAGWTNAGHIFGTDCATKNVECKLPAFDSVKVGSGGWRIRSKNAFELTFKNPFSDEKSLREIFSLATGVDVVVNDHSIKSTDSLFGASRKFGELTRHNIYFNTNTLLEAAQGKRTYFRYSDCFAYNSKRPEAVGCVRLGRWGSGSNAHRASETSNYATGLGIKTKGTDDPSTVYVSNPSVYAERGTTWYGDFDNIVSVYVLVPKVSWTARAGGLVPGFCFIRDSSLRRLYVLLSSYLWCASCWKSADQCDPWFTARTHSYLYY